MQKYIEKISEIINNFFKKHWFWYTIIVALPTIWFSIIIPLLGEFLKLTSDKGITKLGFILSVTLVTPIGILVFLNNWYTSKTERSRLEELQGEIDYLGTITENVDKICEEKYNRLKRIIVDVKSGDKEKPQIVTNPSNQLKRILDGMTSCLVKFIQTPETKYSFKDFTVSLAYNFPMENNEWKWVEGISERDLTLSDLLDVECNSTYRYLMKTQQPYYFNNKKEDAKKYFQYHYNTQDELNTENGEDLGSIFCYNFKVKRERNVYVDAYLSISTNKKRFSIDDELTIKNTRDNMISLVKDSFGKRISIELSLLYLDYLKENNEKR